MTGLGLFGLGSDEEAASYLREKLKGVHEDTLGDFLAKNVLGHCVTPHFTWGGQLISVSEERCQQFFRDGNGWERFRAAYPESVGILEFSRVGLNQGLTQALFYAGVTYDWIGGSGSYWLFVNVDGRWTESENVQAWIS